MDKIPVDDMLIEMITPQVKAIEEKFSRGEGLTQTDIHTLLLKSQYNHINHLDQKLDEVAADNAKLRLDFELRFAGLEQKFAHLETKFAHLETKFEQAQVKMQDTIISTMKWYLGGAGVVLILLKALDIFIK
jgi:hypothetical protein